MLAKKQVSLHLQTEMLQSTFLDHSELLNSGICLSLTP